MPVVAIFTKFDLFIENELQQLMENVEEPDDEETERELERKSEQIATTNFERHFKDALLRKPCPPQAVVALSDGELCKQAWGFPHIFTNHWQSITQNRATLD